MKNPHALVEVEHQYKKTPADTIRYLASQNVALINYINQLLELYPIWISEMTKNDLTRAREENLKWVIKDEPDTK